VSELVEKYLKRKDWQVKENSNMGYSLQGLNNYLSSEDSKRYWLDKVYTDRIKKAYDNGEMHIHDLGLLSCYCMGWNLYDILSCGFTGVSYKVCAKPPKHFSSALGQIVAFIFTLQGEASGAQALSNFDTYLAPYIRADNLSYKQVRQELQNFVYQMNMSTRVGFQTPFFNITLDLTVPNSMKTEQVIIGGEFLEDTYADYQEEMNTFNKALFDVLSEGDANGRVFTFPIPTINITKDFDWNNPVLEDLWRITAKYGIPYFANYINSSVSADDALSMCCRLRLDLTKLNHSNGGLFGAKPLTGSIGVVTINLPRIGYKAENKEQLFTMLAEVMDTAKESLELKRKVIEELADNGLYPYSQFYLRNIKKKSGFYFANHFSTIGLVGMNECLLNFLPSRSDITTEEGKKLALEILAFMRNKCLEFQEETGTNYNLEATPAESTSYRLANKDRELPNAHFATGINDGTQDLVLFYTNSSQVPVNCGKDIYQVLENQNELQSAYTGGTVLHTFVGEEITDWSSIPSFIKWCFTKYSLPYLSITPTFSICRNHGYIKGKVEKCPDCGKDTEVYSRVVGYLTPVASWNEGKATEFVMRDTYKLEVNND